MGANRKNQRTKGFKNKKTKLHLIFDEQERKNFLTGVRKRKDERREKAKAQVDQRIKDEKKRLKQMRKDMLSKAVSFQRVPDVEHLLEPVTYETDQHTVSITQLHEIDFAGTTGIMLGQNKGKDEESDGEAAETSTLNEVDEAREEISAKSLQQNAKRTTNNELRLSKAVKQKDRIKQKRDRSKAKHEKFVRKFTARPKKKKLLRKNKKNRRQPN